MSPTPVSSPGWIQPHLTIAGTRVSSFHVCGVTGLVLGTALAMGLAEPAGLSRAVVAGLLVMGVITFLALAMATKVLTGREALVYYHHEIAVLTSSAIGLGLAGLPVRPSLDVTALGLGVFLACGRCGCVMVGCCHGRPHRWGIRYSDSHAAAGFPPCYVGVRLFPVQALEAVLVAVAVIVGATLIVQRQPAGAALSWYVVSYSTARIWIEELRGDRARPYWLRLSEAQWTSLVLISCVLVAGWQGRIPYSWVHLAAWAVSALSMVVIAARRTASHAMVHPRHASEIAGIVRAADAPGAEVTVRRTSRAVGVSTQSLGRIGDRTAVLYSLSRVQPCLTHGEAQALARLIGHLAFRPDQQQELFAGAHDVFHVVLHAPAHPQSRAPA